MSYNETTGSPMLPVITPADLLTEVQRDATRRYEARRSGLPLGPVTGLPALDRATGGYLEAGIHATHGGPGAGKTALELQIAATCGCPALFVTCEMGVTELWRRVTARVTETYLGRLRSGELPPEAALDLAQRAVMASPQVAFLDGTAAYVTPDAILTRAREIRGEAPHVLVTVDSLHAWVEGAADDLTEYEALNRGMADLLWIANTLNCPVRVVVERNRGSMERGGLSAGAGTRKIEYKAWTVFELDRTEARPDVAGEVPVNVKLPKNRSEGPGAEVPLLFHGAMQRFRDASERGRW